MAQNIIPSDTQASELDVVKKLSALDQQAIIRPNNPPYGLAGFLFDVVLDDQVSLESDITDHYIEDNTAIQDQIALKPEQVTVRGLVAELTNALPRHNPAVRPVNPLPLVPDLFPAFSPGASQEFAAFEAEVDGASSVVTASQSLYSLYINKAPSQPDQTRQSSAFAYFYSLWKSRQLFTVETPWGYWTNMAILSISAKQPEETKYSSEFSVTFKKIRVARDVTVDIGQLAGRNVGQAGASQPTQNGVVGKQEASPEKVDGWLYKWTHGS